MAVRTAYAGAAVSGEVLTAANVNKIPGGWIGHAETTTGQTGIGTTVTDLTSMTVAVTVGASRRIRVSGYVAVQQSASGAGLAEIQIREGGTTLTRSYIQLLASGFGVLLPHVVLTPTAGSHTYVLSGLTSATTMNTMAAANTPVFILVEDLGPAT